jgi:hypothetical protein
MNELTAAVAEFEKVVELSERLSARGDRVTSMLCMFYAMWSAFVIRLCFGKCKGRGTEEAKDGTLKENSLLAPGLPRLDVVRKAVQEFVAATTADDRSGMSNALQDMRVFALCPVPKEHLSRMELIAERVAGRARTIPLVELSLFAVELEDYERAIKYAAEAHTFDPGSWELYNLCVVGGLIALNARKHHEAIEYLNESIRACQRDEHTSLSCGIRVPNLALAEKLLQSGYRVEVLRHLLECKDVWQFLRVKIDKWISLIEAGEAPDFGGAGVLRAISYRLQMQWLRAYSLSLEKEPGVAARKSPAEVMAGRDRLRAEYRRRRGPPER